MRKSQFTFSIISIFLSAALLMGCDNGLGQPTSDNSSTGNSTSLTAESAVSAPESDGTSSSEQNSGSIPISEPPSPPTDITFGTETQRGFINDNTLHSDVGDIHYSSYIPESYDGSEPYALFITLPGWEGLYFQGVGANMVEDFGTEAPKYNDKMIVLSTQLDDWGDTSAEHTIALTKYFLEHYNIDRSKVYLEGLSGGGETGSIVICKRPDLYTAYLMTASKWDGDLNALAKAKTPVYMAIGENDSYYGSAPLKNAYAELRGLYEQQGLTDEEIDRILVLDVKDQSYFDEHGFSDQHAGGMAFAHDEMIMGWLFGQNKKEVSATDSRDFPAELEEIPSGYYSACDEAGTVVKLDYDTYESFSYDEKTQVLHKTAYVYLPYGYSEDKQYNIFYNMHGGWSNETTIMGTDTNTSLFKNIIDNAIKDGKIKPLIMVFPTYNNTSGSDSGDYSLALQLTRNYHNELMNDLIPAVEGKYSTYASSTSREDLIASRDHRGFGGFSMGSVTTWRTFEYCLDYFRYFAPSSGSLTTDGGYMDDIVKNSGYKWNDFYIITMTGTDDFAASSFQRQVEEMQRYPDSYKYSDNENEGNLTFRLKEGYTHDGRASSEYTYNALMWLWNH